MKSEKEDKFNALKVNICKEIFTAFIVLSEKKLSYSDRLLAFALILTEIAENSKKLSDSDEYKE